jgi:hypothetical protein
MSIADSQLEAALFDSAYALAINNILRQSCYIDVENVSRYCCGRYNIFGPSVLDGLLSILCMHDNQEYSNVGTPKAPTAESARNIIYPQIINILIS